MWDGLPADVQGAILDAFAARKACGLWDPRLLHHLPNRQFLTRVAELFRRSLCYARAKTLLSKPSRESGTYDITQFVTDVTRIGIDHVLLQRQNFPHALMLVARVSNVVDREQKRYHDTLRIWCALGYSPSCFHRSAAAEAIHEAKLRRREITRVVGFLNTLFVALYETPMPKIAKRYLTITRVMRARLRELKRLDGLKDRLDQ